MNNKKLSFHIAYRYFRAKNSVEAINIISYISMVAITVLASAMVILLSVFNGFESLLQDLYKAFYPDVKVTALKGKWIDVSEAQLKEISLLEGVSKVSRSLEDMVLIITDESQRVATLKGVDDNWFSVNTFDTFVVEGARNFKGFDATTGPTIAGITIAGDIGINVNNPFETLDLYYPRETDNATVSMEQSLNTVTVHPVGIFAAQAEFDERYLVTPLSTAQFLFEREAQVSSLEIKTEKSAKTRYLKDAISKILGDNVIVQNRYEQNKTINMVMKSEKLVTIVILSFVLIIASFTMVGVLSMIAVDKRKDMSVLRALGANDSIIQNIFIFKGLILAFIGGIIGIILGVLICWGQIQFGWVKLGSGFIIENYPVKIKIFDLITVLTIVLTVGFLAAYFPARTARLQAINFREE